MHLLPVAVVLGVQAVSVAACHRVKIARLAASMHLVRLGEAWVVHRVKERSVLIKVVVKVGRCILRHALPRNLRHTAVHRHAAVPLLHEVERRAHVLLRLIGLGPTELELWLINAQVFDTLLARRHALIYELLVHVFLLSTKPHGSKSVS